MLTPQEKYKKFRVIQMAILGFLPVMVGLLALLIEPFWMGLMLGVVLAAADIAALYIIKRKMGISTQGISASPASHDRQSEQL